jgi:hypothetical protein
MKMESYNYKGYCTARLPDYKKCRNFEEHEVGHGICKYLLFGGVCDWKPDTMDEVVDIFDCKPVIKTIRKEEK